MRLVRRIRGLHALVYNIILLLLFACYFVVILLGGLSFVSAG